MESSTIAPWATPVNRPGSGFPRPAAARASQNRSYAASTAASVASLGLGTAVDGRVTGGADEAAGGADESDPPPVQPTRAADAAAITRAERTRRCVGVGCMPDRLGRCGASPL